MSRQLVMFPEICPPRRESLSSGARRLLGLLKGYAAISGKVFPFQRTLARKLRCVESTVRRWLTELVEWGWLKIHRRGPTSALYELSERPYFEPDERSFERSFSAEPLYEKKQDFKTHTERTEVVPKPVTPDSEFDAYMEIFSSAGKELNEDDFRRARYLWSALSTAEKLAAVRHAVKLCTETQTQFIPQPANHLRGKQWTRVAMPRTLPYRPPLEKSGKIGQAISNAWKRLTADGEDW